jgi:hypothetical protein
MLKALFKAGPWLFAKALPAMLPNWPEIVPARSAPWAYLIG